MTEDKQIYDIVYFHPEGEEYFKGTILQGLKYTVFDPATDIRFTFFGSFIAMCECFYRDGHLIVKGLFLPRYIKIWLRKFRARVVANQLREYNPKVVLTFLDNSNIFHMVCDVMQEVPFLAVQNGGRHLWCAFEALPESELIYHIDEYYCFGNYVKDLFEQYDHDIKKYIISGSLLGGNFYSQYHSMKKTNDENYDICLVSQWSSNLLEKELMPVRWRKLNQAIHTMIALVACYAGQHNKSVCIALRSSDPEERKVFQHYFKDDCSFQESDRLAYSSYTAVTKSKLTIAINSTLATESFGAGMKVLFVNPFKENWLKPTSNSGIWYFSGDNYFEFEGRINNLMKMSQKSYLNECCKEMKRSVDYDYENTLGNKLRKRLLQLTNNTKLI